MAASIKGVYCSFTHCVANTDALPQIHLSGGGVAHTHTNGNHDFTAIQQTQNDTGICFQRVCQAITIAGNHEIHKSSKSRSAFGVKKYSYPIFMCMCCSYTNIINTWRKWQKHSPASKLAQGLLLCTYILLLLFILSTYHLFGLIQRERSAKWHLAKENNGNLINQPLAKIS